MTLSLISINIDQSLVIQVIQSLIFTTLKKKNNKMNAGVPEETSRGKLTNWNIRNYCLKLTYSNVLSGIIINNQKIIPMSDYIYTIMGFLLLFYIKMCTSHCEPPVVSTCSYTRIPVGLKIVCMLPL